MEPYFAEFSRQATFEPSRSSVYLALGTGLLEVVVRSAPNLAEPVAWKISNFLGKVQSEFVRTPGQELLQVFMNMLEILRDSQQTAVQRLE